ncbi:NAD(P)-dependent oxidoreductase [Pseudomonas sp. NPDC089547]|uniref:NAD(P)-dependent oxidoreductase n=1 Tax=Pseudomonas sp. NPDC089547 TaxID=3390652 RepID=UPI003D04076B
MTIAFIGLGQMGLPMAINLLQFSPGLRVHSASGRAYPELLGLGAQPTDDPQMLGRCELVFLSLPDADVVEEILFSPDTGIAKWMASGSTVVDTSTVDHDRTLSIAERLAALGVAYLDAPVSGMAARAVDGTLTVMCGGDPQVLEAVRPYLQSMASNILHMGGVGSGQLAKLVNQLLYNINCAALAEVLPMACKLGLDPQQLAEVVNSGTGRSHASTYFLPHILAGRFDTAYPLQDAYKDMRHGMKVSAGLGSPLPVLSAAMTTYQQALLQGHGADDKGAMIKVYESLLNVQFRAPEGTPPSH